MSTLAKFKKPALIATLFIVASIAILLLNHFSTRIQQDRTLTIPPGPELAHFHFGYAETMADSTWIRSLQNFNGCEQDRGGSSYSPSGARMGLNRTPSCSRGWLYRMLSLVLELAPRFYMAAQAGPTVLSAIVDDIDGATDLYLKAVKLYPNDWVILSRAAGHFALEVEDRPLAARLYLRAVANGAPVWMALYASKLWEKENQKELGRRILLQFRDNDRLTKRDRDYIEQKLGTRNEPVKK